MWEDPDYFSESTEKFLSNFWQKLALWFMALMLIFAIVISPKKKEETAKAQVAMPGNIMIAIRWQDNVDVDVDLWVKAPGDSSIGYSNRAGMVFNLLRDDLGMANDSTKYNYEQAYGRGMPDGEYTVNVHNFRNNSHLTEVPVDAQIYITQGGAIKPTMIAQKRVVLKSVGDEITIANFEIKGERFTGVSNTRHTPLRSAQ